MDAILVLGVFMLGVFVVEGILLVLYDGEYCVVECLQVFPAAFSAKLHLEGVVIECVE